MSSIIRIVRRVQLKLHSFGFTPKVVESSFADATASFHATNPLEHDTVTPPFIERHVREDLFSRLRSDDVFFDVGANIGVYTCLAADCITEGEIIAVEPFAPNIPRIEENLCLNGGEAHIYQVALSDENGEVEFDPAEGVEGALRGKILGKGAEGGITVPQRRGDDLLQDAGHPTPTVIKIDAEGAEENVIHGLRETLKDNTVRLVYLELHAGADLERITEQLSAEGFDRTEIPCEDGNSQYRFQR